MAYLDKAGLEYLWGKLKTKLAAKADATHDHDAASTSAAGFMSAADKTKLNGIATGANAYTHPTSHPASMITGLATVATSGKYSDLSGLPTIPAAVTVDSALSSSSTNPVQNKVVNTALAAKLGKTTYEYNTELALGSTGKVCIGKFPMYDSNISVEIKSTTNITYNGTLVIATQNINTTGGGSYAAKVYGDADNSLTNSIKIQYLSGSNVFSVYIDLPGWSKNLLHIQCVALKGTPTDIATTVDAIPSTATIVPTNALTEKFVQASASITNAEIDAVFP